MSLRFVRYDYGVLPVNWGPPIPYLATYGVIQGWPSECSWIPPGQGAWWEDAMTGQKRHKQLFKHDPANGVYGDCERATLACMLGFYAVDQVPHFCVDPLTGEKEPDGRFWDRLDSWLGEQGYKRFKVPYPGELPFEDVMRSMGMVNPGIYWRLTGTSRNGCDHVVICYGDAIWHDTSLDDSGIVGPSSDGYWWVEVLVSTKFSEFRRPRGHEELPPAPISKTLEVGEPV